MSIRQKVYCIWLGPHDMSPSRLHCLRTIRATIGVPVELITDDTLDEYILPGYPLHPAFQYLSGTTKCDYFRTYMMHHYGGGYTDIKQNFHSWVPAFTALSMQPTKWVQGYREIGAHGIAFHREATEQQKSILRENWMHLLGNGAFICKPKTPFTQAWIDLLHTELDTYLHELQKHPAQDPRDSFGRDLNGVPSQFPIPWAGIAGALFHPTCLQFKEHLLYELPPVHFWDYM